MDKVPILLAAALGCSSEAAARAAAVAVPRILTRGQAYAHQGDVCDCCWIIVEGSAALRAYGEDGQLVQLASYGPGELIGAFPEPRALPATLTAESRSEVIEMNTRRLAALAAEVPGIGLGLAARLGAQQDALLDRMANRMILSAVGRVYAELLALADDGGLIAPAPVLAALALKVNTTRETASRAVAAAERRGLILRGPDGLRIISRARLEALLV